jgi:hypothetical protein
VKTTPVLTGNASSSAEADAQKQTSIKVRAISDLMRCHGL